MRYVACFLQLSYLAVNILQVNEIYAYPISIAKVSVGVFIVIRLVHVLGSISIV